METTRFPEKWSADRSASHLKNGNSVPSYDEQLARIDDFNNELKLRRDIDALLIQFDESQLSNALRFLHSISCQIPGDNNEPK